MGVTENKLLVLFVSCFLLANAQNSDEFVPSKPRYDQASPWIWNLESFQAWDQSCIKIPPTGPKCRIRFFNEYYNHPWNASCIEDNVFLIKTEERQITRTLRSWETKLRNQSYLEYIYDDKPPLFSRIECKSLAQLDFKFDGVGALDHANVYFEKSVNTANVTYQISVEVLLAPAATGEYIFYSVENTNELTSLYFFSESEEKPYLLGGRRTLLASSLNDTSIRIPCVTTDPSVNVTLFKKHTNGSFVEILEADGLLSYDPRVGFLLNSTNQTEINNTEVEYRCFTGDDLPTTSTEYVSVKLGPIPKKLHALYIEVYNQSAVCYSRSVYSTGLTFTNVVADNPAVMQLYITCLQRKHDHCGRTFSDTRREGQPGLECPNNATSCLWITDLYPYGFVYCDAEDEIEPVWQAYFTGFDNTIYTDYKEASPNALVQLTWFSYPRRNTFWMRSFDLLEEMKEVTCTNTLWNNTGNISVSVGIEVKPKPPIKCRSYEFICKKIPSCILSGYRCNGDNDCTDGSDEEECYLCGYKAFKCVNNRTCISKYKKCNHVLDCADGSDEEPALCKSITCSSLSTRCKSGHCIALNKLCDGTPDCLDKSDEDEAHCLKHYPQFEQTSTAVTFVQGLYNHLICGLTRNEFGLNSTIQWWRCGHVVDDDDTRRLWTSHSGLRVKLTFENISKDDSGEYTCIATNILMSTTQTYFVTVRESVTANTTETMPGGDESELKTGPDVALIIFICLTIILLFFFVMLFVKKYLKNRHSQTRSTELVNEEVMPLHNVSSNSFIQ